MTASELAFMGLGLLLGAAAGAALLMVLGTRLPRREIRVTVTRDVVPRRSETLSQSAFVTLPGEPARGGPGDRRTVDRQGSLVPAETSEPAPAAPSVGIPVMAERPPSGARPSLFDRTIVPSPRADAAALPDPAPVPTAALRPSAVAIATELPVASGQAGPDDPLPVRGPALERILRGEHRAMAEILDHVAGADGAQRREWELLLGSLAEGLAAVAVDESVIDFPMGTAFWDTFTVEQCRRIVRALASMGYRYDGRAGWLDGRVPAYRDLTQALADVGLEPRRMRAWPNSAEIAALFAGARPAPEELLAAAGPDYAAERVRELLGEHAARLDDLWLAWEAVRPLLFDPVRTPGSEVAGT